SEAEQRTFSQRSKEFAEDYRYFLEQSGAAHARQLRQVAAQLVDPLALNLERRQVRLGEVAVVLGELFAPLRERALLGLGPAAGLLHDPAAGLEHLRLALDLKEDRAMQRAKRVDVLQLGLHPQLIRSGAPYRDVRLHAHLALFHFGLGCANGA